MSFRPFSSGIRSLGIAGIAFLALIGTSRAGDSDSQNIEIVPFRNPALSTNFVLPDSSQGAGAANFESAMPRAGQSFGSPGGRAAMLPPPTRPQSPQEIKREIEMLDRRKNWVFMTPEEMLGVESSQDSADKGTKIDSGTQSSTVMQRYYERLFDSEQQSATNKSSGKFDADSWTRTGMTNSGLGDFSQPGLSPFDRNPNPGIFEPARGDSFQGLAGSGPNIGQPSPEAVRQQQEQKTHMDDFKQMWGIDQPPPAATAVMAPMPVPAPVRSASPGFVPLQSSAPARIVSLSSPGSLAQPTAGAPPPNLSSSRGTGPPHSDFTPTERPF